MSSDWLRQQDRLIWIPSNWNAGCIYRRLFQLYAYNSCPNEACNNGFYPIHVAAKNASVGVLEALLKYSEDRGCQRKKMITLPDLEGNVPLHSAVHGGEIKVNLYPDSHWYRFNVWNIFVHRQLNYVWEMELTYHGNNKTFLPLSTLLVLKELWTLSN